MQNDISQNSISQNSISQNGISQNGISQNKGTKKKIGKKVFGILMLLGVVIMACCIIFCFSKEAKHGNFENGTTESRKCFSKEEVVDVVYVGNSLLQVPGIPEKVETYAKNSGYQFISHSYLLSGGTLAKSLERVELLDEMKQDLLNADVLVLQEYGDHYETTYEDICKFVQLCGEDTEVYYYMTEFDYDNVLLKKIAFDERVHLIPAVAMVEIATIDMGYDYEEMLKPGDYHPSQTYAHLCGLFTFSAISGQKCVDYPLTENDMILKYMKGETLEEKKAFFEEMYGLVDPMTWYYEEAVKNWE